MKKMIIRAIKVDGGWTLEAENGERPTEGRVVSSPKEAYAECQSMYAGTTWQGRKIPSGYEIVID